MPKNSNGGHDKEEQRIWALQGVLAVCPAGEKLDACAALGLA